MNWLTKLKEQILQFLEKRLGSSRKENITDWLLRFRNNVLEGEYLQFKLNQQKKLLNLVFISALFTITCNWLGTPKNEPLYEIVLIVSRTLLMALMIFSYFLLKKKAQYIEKLLFLIISSLVFLLLIKNNYKDNRLGFNRLYLNAIQIQLLISISIISKINWTKTLLVIIISNAIFCFRVLNEEGKDDFFIPLICISMNIIVFSLSAYSIEKSDRNTFLELKNKELSLVCFKELVNNYFQNPTIICQEDCNILFENKEALKKFSCKNQEELLACFNEIKVKKNNEEEEKGLGNRSKDEENILLNDSFSLQELEDLKQIDFNTGKSSLFEFILNFAALIKSNYHFHSDIRTVYCNKLKNNTIHYDIHVRNIIWEDKNAIMLVFSENKLVKKLKQLKKQAKYKDNLLATMSHELRTPLNGIIGTISESLGMLKNHEARKNLKIALLSSNHLLFMINDILDYYQISHGKIRLNLELFSLWELIQEVTKVIKLQAKLKNLNIMTEYKNIEQDPRAMIRSDSHRIKQVLFNLLRNSLKYTEKGSIVISLEIKQDDEAEEIGDSLGRRANDGKNYLIKVIDTGNGIDKADRPKLFKLFGKLNQKEPMKSLGNDNGVGLGLTISQKLVKTLSNNKEEIEVLSEPGFGSCFSFSLYHASEVSKEENFFSPEHTVSYGNIMTSKYKSLAEKLSANKKPETYKLNDSGENIRILIVDDDQINVLVACSYLYSEKGYFQYSVANNGLRALEIIKSKAVENYFFKIILMDCNMPLINGFEATLAIRELIAEKVIPEVRIIACTANVSVSDYELCFKSGMNDYISKPFSKEDLLSKIYNNLEKLNLQYIK